MLLQLPEILSVPQIEFCRRELGRAQWVDGRVTAGYQAVNVKRNAQVFEGDPVGRQLGAMVTGALEYRRPFFPRPFP